MTKTYLLIRSAILGWALVGMFGCCLFSATAMMTAIGNMSWKGTQPHTISYNTMPKLYTSAGNW